MDRGQFPATPQPLKERNLYSFTSRIHFLACTAKTFSADGIYHRGRSAWSYFVGDERRGHSSRLPTQSSGQP